MCLFYGCDSLLLTKSVHRQTYSEIVVIPAAVWVSTAKFTLAQRQTHYVKNNNNYALFLATHKLCEYTVHDCNAIAQTRAAKVFERALCYVLLQYVFHDDTQTNSQYEK